MNITPKDILDKEFSRNFRGYDPEEVDQFLDEIIKQFESLIEENENVLAKNEELKSEVSKLRASSDKSANLEDRLMSTVLTAQRNATRYLEKAESQAGRIIDAANQNARTMLESAHLRMDAIRQEIVKYERIVSEYKSRFKRLLEEQAAYVDMHTISTNELESTADDVSRSIARIDEQIRDIDDTAEQDTVRINDILRRSKEETDYDFRQNTANLQEIVNDIIDD